MNNQAWWQASLELFAKLSSLIGIPIVVAALLGRWLDKKYNSEPWLFLACIGVAFIVSTVGLVIITKAEYKKLGEEKKDYDGKAWGNKAWAYSIFRANRASGYFYNH